MTKDIILQHILSILNAFGIKNTSSEYYDTPLTGTIFRLNDLDLLYLFFEMEKRLKIEIDATKILEYQFNSVNGIINLLENECVRIEKEVVV